MPAPIPFEAPVTSTALPVNSLCMITPRSKCRCFDMQDDQLCDQPILDNDAVCQDQGVRQVRLVEIALDAAAQDESRPMLKRCLDLERDIVPEDLLRGPGADGRMAEELALDVVDE